MPVHFSRWGVLEIDAIKRLSGSNENSILNHASFTVFEAEDKDGFRFHFLKVSYKKENKLKYVDYRIPVELLGLGHEVRFNIIGDSNRPIVQIFIKGDVAVSAGSAKMKDVKSDEREAGKATYKKWDNNQLDLAASYEASSGIRILNHFELAGIRNGSVRTVMKEHVYGGKATFYLKQLGPLKEFNISGYLLNGGMSSSNSMFEGYVNGKAVPAQNYIQGGFGIGFKF